MAVARIDNIGGGISPEGTLTITQNGTYDVTEYTEADVQVPAPAPTLIGTYTGNKTVNVSSYKRSTDTVNNFIVEMYSCGSSATSRITGDKNQTYFGGIVGFSLTKSLSGNNLAVSGAQASGYIDGTNCNKTYATQNISWRLYHV